jgi:hypothetical protein
MSRPVMQKLAEGKALDKDDVAWARDRGIELPAKYGKGPVTTTLSQSPAAAPSGPVATTSTDLGGPTEEVLETEEAPLEDMTKADLLDLAEAHEIEEVKSSMTKAEIIETIRSAGSGDTE